MMNYFMMKSEGFFNSKALLKKTKEKFMAQVEEVGSEVEQIRVKFRKAFQEIREIIDLKEQDLETQLSYMSSNESDALYSDMNEINKLIDRIIEITSLIHFILHSKNKTYLNDWMFLSAKIDSLSAEIQETTQASKKLSNKYDFDFTSLETLKQILLKTTLMTQSTEIALKSSRKAPPERSNTPKNPFVPIQYSSKEYKSLQNILDSSKNNCNNSNLAHANAENANLSSAKRKVSNHSAISHQNSLSIIDIGEIENKINKHLPFSEEINSNNGDIAILRNRNVSPFRSNFKFLMKPCYGN